MVAAALALLLGACDPGASEPDAGASGRLRVAAALAPLAEVAERVGGDRVVVTDLTPAGGEPHDLELTTDQMDDLLDADVVLLVNSGFQPSVVEASERAEATVVDVFPHSWLDPTTLMGVAGRLADALADADPDGAADYRAAARAYSAELETLDRDIADGLTACDRRVIVTAHAAFDPFAERYDLTALSIGGSTPDAEPDPSRLAELTDRIRSTGITTVFTEPAAEDADLAATLAREAGVTTAVLDPAERLEAGTSYADLQRQNLAALRTALGCDA